MSESRTSLSIKKHHFFLAALFSFLTYIFAFGNQVAISNFFGTSSDLDSYWIAMSVVSLLGFYIHPFRESLTSSVHQGKSLDIKLASKAITSGIVTIFVLGLLLSLFLILLLFSEYLNNIFNNSKELFKLLLAFLPYFILFGLAELTNGLLTSFNLPIEQGLSRLIAAFSSLIIILYLGDRIGVFSLVLSLFISQISILFISSLILYKNGIRFLWDGFTFIKDNKFISMLGVLLFNCLLAQIYLFYERWAMSQFQAGSISSYQYAISIVNVLISIFCLTLINMIWPVLLNFKHADDHTGMVRIAVSTGKWIILTLTALALFVFMYSENIVEIIFSRGSFVFSSQIQTAQALRLTIFAAISVTCVMLGLRVLMSQRRNKAVLIVSSFIALSGISIISLSLFFQSIIILQLHWFIANLFGSMLAWYFIFSDKKITGLVEIKIISIEIAKYAVCIIAPLPFLPRIFLGKNFFLMTGSLCLDLLIYFVSIIIISLLTGILSISDLKNIFNKIS